MFAVWMALPSGRGFPLLLLLLLLLVCVAAVVLLQLFTTHLICERESQGHKVTDVRPRLGLALHYIISCWIQMVLLLLTLHVAL